jgi:hypothetical protein
MRPGRYTELFFLDEATAMAAGHRPCAECRREDYSRFNEVWAQLGLGQPGADAIDARLHRERVDPARSGHRLHRAPLSALPDGAFVLHDDEPWLVLDGELLRWTPAGYAERRPKPLGEAKVITPPSLIEVLRSGWESVVPLLHPSARR